MKEQDKVEEFTNGRVGMMIDSLAHVNLIRKNNPNLKFTLSAIPAKDGFTGKRGIPYASWGIGIADNSKHKAEAFKLVSYLMSQDVNAKISSLAHGFPGNKNSTPDYVSGDPLFKAAFDIYKSGYPANEFVGLPVAEQLMRDFDEQFQLYLAGKQSIDDTLAKAQAAWVKDFAGYGVRHGAAAAPKIDVRGRDDSTMESLGEPQSVLTRKTSEPRRRSAA